jgi:hypothetical protein
MLQNEGFYDAARLSPIKERNQQLDNLWSRCKDENWLLTTSDTGGEVERSDWTSSITIGVMQDRLIFPLDFSP